MWHVAEVFVNPKPGNLAGGCGSTSAKKKGWFKNLERRLRGNYPNIVLFQARWPREDCEPYFTLVNLYVIIII